MTIARTKALGVGLAVALLSAWASQAWAVTAEDVQRAINKGREFLINQQNGDGSFGKNAGSASCDSALAFMTLAYMGEHPNHDVMSKGLDYLIKLDAKQFTYDGGLRCGYAVPIRVMGFSYVLRNPLSGEKRALLRAKVTEDLLQRTLTAKGRIHPSPRGELMALFVGGAQLLDLVSILNGAREHLLAQI